MGRILVDTCSVSTSEQGSLTWRTRCQRYIQNSIIGPVVSFDAIIHKLGESTFDNASNNDTSCSTIEKLHWLLDLKEWKAKEKQLMYVSMTFDMYQLTPSIGVLDMSFILALGI